MIQRKIKSLSLALNNFPQIMVNTALLVLSITNRRIKMYMFNINDALMNDSLKRNATSIVEDYFIYIIVAITVKTMITIITIAIHNR